MEQLCVRVAKKSGEPARRALMELGLIDHSARIASDNDFLYFPLLGELPADYLAVLPGNARVIGHEFCQQEQQLKLDDVLGFTPHYEVVGAIAIIEADEPHAERIAQTLIDFHPHIKTVLGATSAVEGEFRTRQFRVLAGEDRTETIHKDHGCRYMVDLARAYFTPRLSTERQRIVAQLEPGSVVVDMFAGVGPYTIPAARKCHNLIAIDKNPDAVRFLRKNVDMNSVENVEVIEGDANDVARDKEGVADHVIMNLPHSAYEFLDAAITMVRHDGVIHYYAMTPEDDLFESSIKLIHEAAHRVGRTIKVLNTRTVRSYAPHQYNVCIDVKID
ncbi:MAG: class I SAM-dependent methyltransferase family protein [Methanosarcinaceae archaeon]|nr:class I SAM-dependent methyltransferase family protein [Methanosarcinaceae archaeon]